MENAYKRETLKDRLKLKIFTAIDKPLQLFFSSASPRGIPVIVLLKPLGLGDLIMLSPIFELVKKKHSQFYVLSDYPCIFQNLDDFWIRTIDSLSIDEPYFFIFPSPSFSNLKFFVKTPGPFLGNLLRFPMQSVNSDFNEVTDHYFERVRGILGALNVEYPRDLPYAEIKVEQYRINGRYLCVSPFCNWRARRAPVDAFCGFISRTSDQFDRVVIVGGSGSEEIEYNKQFANVLNQGGYRVINLTGETSIAQLAYVIRESQIYVGNDSGPTHVAMICSSNVHVLDGCIPLILRIPVNREYSRNIKSYGKSLECPAFPCYSGVSEPLCRVTPEYQCMKVSKNEF